MDRIDTKVLELVRQWAPDRGLRVLEACPGRGRLTRRLLDNGYANLETLDIHPEHFGVKEVVCHKGDLNKTLPFEDGQYDLIIAVEGIEHLERQYDFAAECNRILKDGGHLILTTPNINNFASRIKFLTTGFYSLCPHPWSEFEKNWVHEHIYPLTFWQLRHIMHTNGLFIRHHTTDHIRRSALIGLPYWPISLLFTWLNLRKEKDPRQLKVHHAVVRQMHSPSIYFGRTQILVVQKQPSTYIKET